MATTKTRDEMSNTMHAMTIKPYTGARKMRLADFWDMVEAQETRHDEYTYTLCSTATDFDVVYCTAESDKCTVSISDFFAYYLDSQLRVDGVAIVLQHCYDFYTVFIIEN